MTSVRAAIRRPRIRPPVVAALGVVLVLALSANGLAVAYTDWLWFDDLGVGSVWTTIELTKLGLAAAFASVFFVVLWGNLVVADRIAPRSAAATDDELVARYQQLVRGRIGTLRLILALVLAVVAGGNTASRWQEWLLFRNSTNFGRFDPLFGRDVGFYLFRLPFLAFALDWIFAALILVLIVVTVVHYLNGGLRATVPFGRANPGVRVHLSLLLAALAVVRAGGYWLDRFELVNSSRGAYDGALATAVDVQWPAYNLLALVSLFVAVVFVANLRRQGWGLPLVAIGLWMACHVLVGSAFPALYQRLRVESQATTREQEYVEHNIEATRFAYGLDPSRLTVEPLDYKPGLTRAEVADYASVLDNVPLVDPQLARESFIVGQGKRAFYHFSDPLDVDRYLIDGQVRPVVLSVRGLDLGVDEISPSWESQHIVFTHGYGAVMATGWEVGSDGQPRFLVQELGDVAVDETLGETLGQPRVYFGEDFGGYAIVKAERQEVDFQTSNNESQLSTYDGTGGVPLGGLVRRSAFALRFHQLDPLIAPALTNQSEAIYNRDIAERVRLVAPFLRFDSDPYPVVANDQIYWVIDGYTTSDAFPYAQRVRADAIDLFGTDLSSGVNYVRNSVKAVVDAYNGDVQLYAVDRTDPVLQTWDKAFPGLFVDARQIPPEIRDNLRYPKDIFRLQTTIWSTYVVDDARQLIQGDVAWSVAAQPRSEAQVGEGEPTDISPFMRPQYLTTRLPGKSDEEFVLQRAFVPRSGGSGSSTARPELTGVMVARSDPDHLGELVLYKIPSTAGVEAPDYVHSEIRKDDQLTEFIKEKLGSVVSFGQMTLLLIDDTVVYVRPVYVEAASATAVPELSRVIVSNGSRIAMGETLREALDELVGDTSDQSGDEPVVGSDFVVNPSPVVSDGGPATAGSVGYDPTGRSLAMLLADAEQFLAAADVARADGDEIEAAALEASARTALSASRTLLGAPVAPAAALSGPPIGSD